jgi:Mor family transcriptional regulator
MAARIGPDVEQEICNRYIAGESVTRLAELFSTHSDTFYRILRRSNVDLRHAGRGARKLNDAQEQSIYRRHQAGEGVCQLARLFGVDHSTIRAIIRRQEAAMQKQAPPVAERNNDAPTVAAA